MKRTMKGTMKFVVAVLLLFSSVSVLNAQTQTVKEGDLCPDIVLKDTAMVDHTLKEFRGKYVYIDVWASWCTPCRNETPFLHKLEDNLKGRNIVFVGVNVDSRDFRFKGMVDSRLGYYTGIQWWDSQKVFEKAFNVDRIPRFILLDPQGKIKRLQMTRPSNAETLAYLQNILK